MRPFGFSGNMTRGYQRHHLIPVNIIGRRAFESLFGSVSTVGFDPRDFLSNGLLLPATDEIALATGMPLHRGPHRHYDALVAEYLGEISNDTRCGTVMPGIPAFRRLSELQGTLRRALCNGATPMLNRNDPRATTTALCKLDYDILQMSPAQLLS